LDGIEFRPLSPVAIALNKVFLTCSTLSSEIFALKVTVLVKILDQNTRTFVKTEVIRVTDFTQGYCNRGEGSELNSIEIKGRRIFEAGVSTWESTGGLWGQGG